VGGEEKEDTRGAIITRNFTIHAAAIKWHTANTTVFLIYFPIPCTYSMPPYVKREGKKNLRWERIAGIVTDRVD
jgi:hypothetical protein